MFRFLIICACFISLNVQAGELKFTRSQLCTIAGYNAGNTIMFLSYIAINRGYFIENRDRCNSDYAYGMSIGKKEFNQNHGKGGAGLSAVERSVSDYSKSFNDEIIDSIFRSSNVVVEP